MTSSLIISVVLFFAGYIAAKVGHDIGVLTIEMINTSLFYIAIPIIIFESIYSSKNFGELILVIAVSILHIVIIFVIAFSSISIWRRIDKPKAIAFSLSLAMPNAGYLAIPLSIILYNESTSVIPYTIAFNVVLPIVILVLSLNNDVLDNRCRKIKLVVARLAPFLSAFVLALLTKYFDTPLPKPLYMIFDSIKWYTVTSFVLVGYEFAKVLQIDPPKRLVFVYELLTSMIIRYVVSPLLIWVLIIVLNIFEYYRGLVLQSIMPPAVTNVVLAKTFKLDTNVVSTLIVVLTPISVALSFILKILSII